MRRGNLTSLVESLLSHIAGQLGTTLDALLVGSTHRS